MAAKADEIGVKESTLRQINGGRLDLSRKMCNKVCDHFQEFNLEWLLNGNGNMYVDDLEPKDEKDKYYGCGTKATEFQSVALLCKQNINRNEKLLVYPERMFLVQVIIAGGMFILAWHHVCENICDVPHLLRCNVKQ